MPDFVAGVFLLAGAAFTLIASFGLLRFRDTFSRLQVSSKVATLGTACALIGSLANFGWGLKEVAVIVFLFLTVPAGAHILSK
ncbi:MAG: monovalent cation/H(+) antiporter subunit G, partial [Armatimonadota bacterium]|nr:monovalent cation/H(+) antiporter subunit G [Armatimonadota bacterium]